MFYDCLIIPVVHMPPPAYKIVVSLFHAFIAATSGKPITKIKFARYRSYDLGKIRC